MLVQFSFTSRVLYKNILCLSAEHDCEVLYSSGYRISNRKGRHYSADMFCLPYHVAAFSSQYHTRKTKCHTAKPLSQPSGLICERPINGLFRRISKVLVVCHVISIEWSAYVWSFFLPHRILAAKCACLQHPKITCHVRWHVSRARKPSYVHNSLRRMHHCTPIDIRSC